MKLVNNTVNDNDSLNEVYEKEYQLNQRKTVSKLNIEFQSKEPNENQQQQIN